MPHWRRSIRSRSNPDKALAQFTLAIERQPDRAELYRGRAEVDLARPSTTTAQRARALRDLDRAIALDRAQQDHFALAQDYLDRARLLEIDHHDAEALEACEAALAVRRDYTPAHQLRIGLLLSGKRFDEAMRSCDELIGQGRTSGWVLEERGLARFFSGDYPGAIEDYTRTLDFESDRATLRPRTSRPIGRRSWPSAAGFTCESMRRRWPSPTSRK